MFLFFLRGFVYWDCIGMVYMIFDCLMVEFGLYDGEYFIWSYEYLVVYIVMVKVGFRL